MTKSSPSDRFESGEFDPSVIKSLLKGFRLTKPLIAAVEGPAIAGGTEILQATDIRVAGRVGAVRGVRAAVGAVPAGRLGGPAPPPDPLHGRGRPAADRAAHQGAGGQGARPDRARRTRRAGAGEGARACRPGRRQRPARRPGRAPDDPRTPRASTRTTAGRTTPPSVRPSSRPTTPRRARGRSWRSGRPSSPGARTRGRHLSCRPCPSSTSGSSSSRSASSSSWWGSCAVASGATRSPSGRPPRAGSTSPRTARWSTASRASRSVAAAAAVRGT